jgi:hypothetical protein
VGSHGSLFNIQQDIDCSYVHAQSCPTMILNQLNGRASSLMAIIKVEVGV